MSKNLTRKGLAFGAMVALGASSLVAAPAVADTTGPVTLVPDQGTTFNSILQSGITLKTELDPREIGVEEAGSLSFLIENPGAAAISADFDTAGALDEQINYRSDTNWALTGISPAATKGARLNGEATTTAADDDLWVAATYATDNAKFAYVTGSSSAGVATYSAAIDASQQEIQTYGTLTITNSATYVLTLPNGSVLSMTADGSATIGEIVDGLKLDGDYDANYAALSVATNDMVITYGDEFGNVGAASLSIGGAAGAAPSSTTDGDAASFNFGTTASKNTLTLATTETTKNVTLYVTAFLDENGNGVKDTFEEASDRETVILYAPSNVSAVTTIEYLARDNAFPKVSVVYNNNINPWYVQGKTFVKLFNNGTLVDVTNARKSDAADDNATDFLSVGLSATTVAADLTNGTVGSRKPGITKNVLTAGAADNGAANRFFYVADDTPTPNQGDTADFNAGVYTAQAYYQNTATPTYVAIGAASIAADLTNGNNADVDTLDAYVLNTANLKFTDGSGALAVRTGTKTFDVKVQAEDSNVDLKASAIKFRATVTATTLDSGAVTVTGSQVSLAEDDSTVGYAFSDSTGIATFTIGNSVGTEDDVVTIVVEVLAADGKWKAAETITATWADATLSSWSARPGLYVSGATPTVTFVAYDQWSQPVSADADGKALSVAAVASFGGITDATKYSKTVAMASGVAEFSFTNFATAGSFAQLVATLKAGSADASLPGGASSTITVNVYNTLATDRIIVGDTFSNAITYKDYVTGDTIDPVVAEAVTKAGYVAADYETITGSVLNAAGVGQPGMAVTIAGAGMMFKAGTVYAEDSVVAYTNEYGAFTVDVFAHTVATRGATITFTADGKSASTLMRTYLPAGLGGDNLQATWTVPANLVKNTTYGVTVSLKDKWGNPVATATNGATAGVTVQAFGPLEVNATTNAVSANFNASGHATVYLRSVLDLVGKGSINYSIGAANYSYWKEDTKEVAVTALSDLGVNLVDVVGTAWDETSWTPAGAVEIEILSTAPAATDAKLNAGSFNGYVAVYAKGYKGATLSWKIAGVWFKTTIDSDYVVFQRKTAAVGVDVNVELYINGQRPAAFTKTVTTK